MPVKTNHKSDFNLKSSLNDLASILTYALSVLPSHTGGCLCSDLIKPTLSTYSCSYSSGITPDSLLILARMPETKVEAKVQLIIKANEKKSN